MLKRPLKLRSHLALLVLAAVLPLLIFAGYLIRESVRDQQRAIERGMRDTVRALSLAVDREMAIAQAILETLAGSHFLKWRDFEMFYQVARDAAAKRPGSRIVLFDMTGQQVINTYSRFGQRLPNVFREERQTARDSDYPELAWGRAESVRQVIETGHPVTSDVFVGMTTKRPTVTIDVPVLRDGKVSYVINMAFEADSFTQLLSEQRLPAGWVAEIFDRKGINFGRTTTPGKFVGRPASRELLQQIAEKNEGFGAGPIDADVPLYHAFVRSPVTGWITAVGFPRSQTKAQFNRPFFLLGAGGAVVLLAGLATAWYFGRRLARTTARLADLAEALQRGEPVEIQPSSIYEIEVLRHELINAGAAARESAAERERRIAAEVREAEAEAARDIIAASEAKLRESDERFRLLLGGIKDHAIFMLDSRGCIATWNTGAERLTGFSYAEALGRGVEILYQLKDRVSGKPAQDLQAAGAAAEDAPYERDGCLLRSDGAKFHGDITLAALRTPEAGIRGYSCVIRNVTERKQAEEAVRANEDRFRRAADATGAIVYEANVVTDGPAWAYGIANILGEDAGGAELTSEWWHARIHPEDIGAHREHLRRCITDRRCNAYSASYRVGHSDGSWRDVKDTGQILRGTDGTAYRLVGTVVDVTASKQAEDALRRYAEQLKEADQRKNEFLATLAHELRNPLAPIRNAVEILKKPGLTPDKFQIAREITEHQVEHMVRLIDDLLDVSRISRGKIELKKERVSLKSIVDQAIETSRPHIEENWHQLLVTLPSDPVYLDADPVRLAQVLSNLINNACKYSEEGGKVEIRASLQSIFDLGLPILDSSEKTLTLPSPIGMGEGGTEQCEIENPKSKMAVVISVRDTGIGIAPEHLPRLFQMFSQVESTMERAQGGLGIGLSLVKGLVEMHGGRVEAKSDGVGRGSEFIVRLPALDSDEQDEIPLSSPFVKGGKRGISSAQRESGETRNDELRAAGRESLVGELPVTSSSANPEPETRNAKLDASEAASLDTSSATRVLVVDDNRAQAQSLELLLETLGYVARSAYDGGSALALFREFAPQIALVDLGLPDITGFELARRIIKMDQEIFLIAQTGWGREEDRERSRQAGFQHHLTKPIDPEALEKVLKTRGRRGTRGENRTGQLLALPTHH